MIYKFCFYLMLLIYLYSNITSDIIMVEKSFKGLVILGILTLIDRR